MGQIALQSSAKWHAATRLKVAEDLQSTLKTLDELGAHIAAAHIDVAIVRLREEVDQAQME